MEFTGSITTGEGAAPEHFGQAKSNGGIDHLNAAVNSQKIREGNVGFGSR